MECICIKFVNEFQLVVFVIKIYVIKHIDMRKKSKDYSIYCLYEDDHFIYYEDY